MSEHEANVYFKFVASVKDQISQLTDIVSSLQSKGIHRNVLISLTVNKDLSERGSNTRQLEILMIPNSSMVSMNNSTHLHSRYYG